MSYLSKSKEGHDLTENGWHSLTERILGRESNGNSIKNLYSHTGSITAEP